MKTDTTGPIRKVRTYVGEVLSNKMDKTVVVVITRTFVHPRYRKVLRKVTRLKAHDERKECRVGDRVRIQESRPISKEKHWRVVEILERSKGAPLPVEEPAPVAE